MFPSKGAATQNNYKIAPLQLPHDAVPQRNGLLQEQNFRPGRRCGTPPLPASVRPLEVGRALRPSVIASRGADLGGQVAVRLVDLIQGVLFFEGRGGGGGLVCGRREVGLLWSPSDSLHRSGRMLNRESAGEESIEPTLE